MSISKLWVDDERPAPDETWDVAKSYEEAVTALKFNDYDVISLDYILIGWESGLDVLLYIDKVGCWPKELHSHSGSSSTRWEIFSEAQRLAPEGVVIIEKRAG